MKTYPVKKIYEEVSFIAYYFHWSHDEIMAMDHQERRSWCEEISKINKELSDEKQKDNVFDIF